VITRGEAAARVTARSYLFVRRTRSAPVAARVCLVFWSRRLSHLGRFSL